MKKKHTCGYCKKEVKEGDKKCPHCGKEFSYWKKKKKKSSIKDFLKFPVLILASFIGGLWAGLIRNNIAGVLIILSFIILSCYNYYKRKGWFESGKNLPLIILSIISLLIGYSVTKFGLVGIDTLYLIPIILGFFLIFSGSVVTSHLIKQRKMGLIPNSDIVLSIGILSLFNSIFFLLPFLFKGLSTITNGFTTIIISSFIVGIILISYSLIMKRKNYTRKIRKQRI